MESTGDITQLLQAWAQGDEAAFERLKPLVERELRRRAKSYKRREFADVRQQTTAIINDVFVRLEAQRRVQWQNRSHFYAIAATCMRRILLDYVKAQNRQKRGDGVEPVSLSEADALADEMSFDVLALDLALQKLAKQDKRKSQMIEMQAFGGCTVEEIADFFAVSKSTIERELRVAMSWLRRELGGRS